MFTAASVMRGRLILARDASAHLPARAVADHVERHLVERVFVVAGGRDSIVSAAANAGILVIGLVGTLLGVLLGIAASLALGKYQLIKELGRGATGKVYLADDPFANFYFGGFGNNIVDGNDPSSIGAITAGGAELALPAVVRLEERIAARIEAGLRSVLDAGGFKAFTDTFEDLGRLEQFAGA